MYAFLDNVKEEFVMLIFFVDIIKYEFLNFKCQLFHFFFILVL